MIGYFVSRYFILFFGTLYPAYGSYKALRSESVHHYSQWIKYWIVSAILNGVELFTDKMIFWFPFYYEFKVIMVLWLLPPLTQGSSILYAFLVQPMLGRHEQKIDEFLGQSRKRICVTILQLSYYGIKIILNAAISIIIYFFQKSNEASSLADGAHEHFPDVDVPAETDEDEPIRSAAACPQCESTISHRETDVKVNSDTIVLPKELELEEQI